MSTPDAGAWLDLLQRCCAQVPTRFLHVIIDQAGRDTPLLASVQSVEPPIGWHSLYTGLPEESAEDLAPLLLRIDLEKPLQQLWLAGLMQELYGQDMLLALISPWPFHALAAHLSACLQASQGGASGLLRYYDPRVFALLFSHVLRPEQQQRWRQPAFIWSWLDRDGKPRHLPGAPTMIANSEALSPTELSDTQVETLDCASDAKLALDALGAELPGIWSAERRFQACYAAMLEATQQGLIADSQRLAFARDRLNTLLTEQPADPRKPTV